MRVRARAAGVARSEPADRAWLEEFVRNDYARVVATVGAMTGSLAAAEDVVQEAMTRAWEGSQRGDHIVSTRAWVTAVAVNLARSKARRLLSEGRARQLLANSSLATANPGSTLAPVDDRVDIMRAVAALPRRQREVTLLHYYLDLEVAEVARILRITEGTTKTSLHRARRKLAETLGERERKE